MKINNLIMIWGCFILLSSILVTVVVGFYTGEKIIELNQKQALDLISFEELEQIEHLFDMEIVSVRFFSDLLTNKKFILAEGTSDFNVIYAEVKNDRLNTIMKYSPYYLATKIINAKGIVLASTENDEGINLSESDIFLKAKEEVYIKSVYYSKLHNKNVFTISCPINYESKFLGVIEVVVDSKILETIFDDEESLGETYDIFIVNSEKQLITKPKFLTESEILKTKLETQNVKDCFQHKAQGEHIENIEYLDYRGITTIGTHQYVSELDWCIIAKIDKSELVSPARNMIPDLLITAVILLLLSAIIIYFISRRISKPITDLSNNVDAITKGDLDVRLKHSEITEINKLIESLNRILASMKLAILRSGLSQSELGLGEVLKAKDELQKRYKLLYESSDDAIMTLEPPLWNFTAGNPATIKLFNAKDEQEFISSAPWRLSPKYQLDGQLSSDKAKEMIELAMKTGFNTFEWTHKKITGEEFLAKVKLIKVTQSGREFLQAIVTDISEDRALLEKLELYKKGFGISKNSMVLAKYENKLPVIMEVNKTFTEIYGYSLEEVVGNTPSILKSGMQDNKF